MVKSKLTCKWLSKKQMNMKGLEKRICRNSSSATHLICISISVNTGTDQVPLTNKTFMFKKVNKNFHGQQRMARKTINMTNLEMNCGKN